MRIKSYHIFLILINLIAIIFIVQIQFQIIPLFDSNLSNSTIKNINKLTLNFANGLLISSIFYLIVVYYPEHLKKKSTLEVIEPRLKTIVNQLQESLNYLHQKRLNSKNENFEKLKEEDFHGLNSLDLRTMNYSYRIRQKSNIQWTGFNTAHQKELDYFEHQRKLIIGKIDYILELPTITYINDDLIKILAKLRDSWFYFGVKTYYNHRNNNLNMSVNKFDKATYEYYQFYKKLKRHIKPNLFEIK